MGKLYLYCSTQGSRQPRVMAGPTGFEIVFAQVARSLDGPWLPLLNSTLPQEDCDNPSPWVHPTNGTLFLACGRAIKGDVRTLGSNVLIISNPPRDRTDRFFKSGSREIKSYTNAHGSLLHPRVLYAAPHTDGAGLYFKNCAPIPSSLPAGIGVLRAQVLNLWRSEAIWGPCSRKPCRVPCCAAHTLNAIQGRFKGEAIAWREDVLKEQPVRQRLEERGGLMCIYIYIDTPPPPAGPWSFVAPLNNSALQKPKPPGKWEDVFVYTDKRGP